MKLLILLIVSSSLFASPCSTCTCGRRKASRIVGGEEALPNEFPWQVRLKYADGSFFCGGSLISSEWVVTAAHCVSNTYAMSIFATLGEHNASDDDPISIDYSVSEIHVHEKFSAIFVVSNDIALLKLSTKVFFSNNISPVCLPFNQLNSVDNFDEVTVSGWGRTEKGEISDVLKKGNLSYIDPYLCRLHPFYTFLVSDKMICACSVGKSPCNGDSGGPLVWENEDANNFLMGIVSWGYFCAVFLFPSVYVRVTAYLDWIVSITGDVSQFCIP